MASKYDILPTNTDWRNVFRVADVKQSPIDSRDFPALAREEPPVTLPASFQLDRRTIRNQGGKGACVAFTFARIMERAYALLRKDFDGSEEEFYAKLREIHNWLCQDTGSYPRDAAEISVKEGWLTEAQYPYNDRELCQAPDPNRVALGAQFKGTEFRAARTWEDAKQIIYQHKVGVSICFTVYDNFFDIKSDGIMPMPSGRAQGGHCMTLEGWDPTHAWVANSWSVGFGLEGYIRVPLKLVDGSMPESVGGAWLTDQFTVLALHEVEPTPPDPTDPNCEEQVREAYMRGYNDSHKQRRDLVQESVEYYRPNRSAKAQFAADVCEWHLPVFDSMTPPAQVAQSRRPRPIPDGA